MSAVGSGPAAAETTEGRGGSKGMARGYLADGSAGDTGRERDPGSRDHGVVDSPGARDRRRRCGRGGTGRRAGFRSRSLRGWRFESSRPHPAGGRHRRAGPAGRRRYPTPPCPGHAAAAWATSSPHPTSSGAPPAPPRWRPRRPARRGPPAGPPTRCRWPTAARASSRRCGGEVHRTTVAGPLGDPVDAEWRMVGPSAAGQGPTAVLEIGPGHRAGPPRLPRPATIPCGPTTTGVGQLVLAARRRRGAPDRGRPSGGRPPPTEGGGRSRRSAPPARLGGAELVVACDVVTPFRRAAEVFGPQKGATPDQVAVLTARLGRAGRALPPGPRGRRDRAARQPGRPGGWPGGWPPWGRAWYPVSTWWPTWSGSPSGWPGRPGGDRARAASTRRRSPERWSVACWTWSGAGPRCSAWSGRRRPGPPWPRPRRRTGSRWSA